MCQLPEMQRAMCTALQARDVKCRNITHPYSIRGPQAGERNAAPKTEASLGAAEGRAPTLDLDFKSTGPWPCRRVLSWRARCCAAWRSRSLVRPRPRWTCSRRWPPCRWTERAPAPARAAGAGAGARAAGRAGVPARVHGLGGRGGGRRRLHPLQARPSVMMLLLAWCRRFTGCCRQCVVLYARA